jgi:D-alanyl-D-alanine carboxypeptidase
VKRLLVAVAVIVLGGALSAVAPATASTRAPLPVPSLSSALAPLLAAGAPGAVALTRHGSHIERAGIGWADLVAGRPMRSGDLMRVGSITKTFVAVVVLQLVDEGRLSLDDTVESRLPGVLPYGAEVSVRNLLSHTGGIPEYLPKVVQIYGRNPATWFAHWSPSQLVALVAHAPRLSPPGDEWAYANTDFVLLGMIIERVTGHSVQRELNDRILAPAGLRHTTFALDQRLATPPAAHGYLPDGHGRLLDSTVWNPSAVWAAGAMVSTVDDLMRFHKALLTGSLLPPPRLAEMLTFLECQPVAYGLGIYRIDTPCGPAIGHNGAVYGYLIDVFSSRDGSRQVVVGTNILAEPVIDAQMKLVPLLFCR